MARNSRELARRPAVDPTEEPSAEWGWHGGFPKGRVIGGVVSIIALLLYIPGAHQGTTHVLWLVGAALLIAVLLVRGVVAKRHSWRR